jgi:hypothetical protein
VGQEPPDEFSGVEATTVDDQPGRATEHQEYVRAAYRNIGGDVIAGDKLVLQLTGGQPNAQLIELSPTLVDLARSAFVEPEGWDRVRLDFRERRLVVLRGRPGHGRITMAIRLLKTVDTPTIFQLPRQVDLTTMAEQITRQQVGRRTAFLLSEPEDLSRLDASTFERLEAALESVDARLVITVGTESVLSDEGLLRYGLWLPTAPPAGEILFRHLRHLLDDESRARRILEQPDVERLVAEHLAPDNRSCEHAAVLAQILAAAGEPVDAEKIRELLDRHSTDAFDIWFDNLEPVPLRCFAIALAVLDGLSYEDVAAAARQLRDLLSLGGALRLGTDGVLEQIGPEPFQLGRAQLVQRLQARTNTGTVRTPYGWAPALTVGYRNRNFPRRIIERSWQGYQIQDQLLEWLGALAQERSEQVRTYASTAVGLVATLAFDYVRERFKRWAESEHERLRQAVADALRVVAMEPELKSGVQWMVDGWYTRGTPAAQATAAVAWGTGLGHPDAHTALQALERLTRVDHFLVRFAIGRGITAPRGPGRRTALQCTSRQPAWMTRTGSSSVASSSSRWPMTWSPT